MSLRRGGPVSLFVFIDAFGWELYQRHAEGFLKGELQTAQPLETVLGYSCACDPTILTGLMPQQHGHFSFFQYAPDRSPFGACRWLKRLPRPLVDRGRVRRVLSRWIARRHGFDGYFQLYNVPFERLPLLDYSEKRDLYQPGGILSGDPTIFDLLRQDNLPFHVSDWRVDEQSNIRSLLHEVERGEIRWAYLYLAAMDGVLHADGVRSPRVEQHIQWYDEQLRQVLQAARRRYSDVRMFVFSDHGMTDVRQHCDLQSEVASLGLTYGRDYAAVYDSTMARFWMLDRRAEAAIRGLLDGHPQGRVVGDVELAELGCLFPQRQYGELFFLLEPGTLLCPSDMGQRPIRGMHGYHPEHRDSTALLAANCELPAPAPTRLDDLFGLMRREAGLGTTDPGTSSQGSLIEPRAAAGSGHAEAAR